MELRTAASPRDVKHYTTERLREEFLIEKVSFEDEIRLVYSHIDRIITGAVTVLSRWTERNTPFSSRETALREKAKW